MAERRAYPPPARRRAGAAAGVAVSAWRGIWARHAAVATRICARRDHVLRAFVQRPAHRVQLPACYPNEVAAALAEFGRMTLVWSGPGAHAGALRVPTAETFARGWQPAASFRGLDPTSLGAVIADESDGVGRGLLVMDERGRTACVFVDAAGIAWPVAKSLEQYLESCLRAGASCGWASGQSTAAPHLPSAEDAADDCRVVIRCRDLRALSLDELRARRLERLSCRAELASALGVPIDRLLEVLRAAGPRARLWAVAQVLRQRRDRPQTLAELRHWAYLNARDEPWVDVELEFEASEAVLESDAARLAWLALAGGPGGAVVLTPSAQSSLAEDVAAAAPAPDDEAGILWDASGAGASFSLAAARRPSGCVAGARWLAVVPRTPRTAGRS